MKSRRSTSTILVFLGFILTDVTVYPAAVSRFNRALRTATGEKLAWRQVYRAAEALEELSKRDIQFIHHNKHGKMLIKPNPANQRHCQSSSAVPT